MNASSSRKKTKYVSFAAPKQTSPGLDNVVTVENCHYYLSLLEQFMHYKQTFDVSLLSIMLARAEARYVRWRDLNKMSFAKASQELTPPIDVAYMWHVHMLSPFKYYEDALRLSQQNVFSVDLPLYTIHQRSMSTSVLDSSASKWEQYFGPDEPYMITPYNVVIGTTEVLCCFCKNGIQCGWIEYADWRYNSTTTVSCPQCHCKTSVGMSSVANLINDIDRGHIAGMMLDNNGKYEPEQARCREITLTNCITEAENSQLDGQRLFHLYQSANQIISTIKAYSNSLENTHPHRLIATTFEKTINTCYSDNPSPFSIDLIRAVYRQQEFNMKVGKKVDWQGGLGIARGILQYYKFLQLFAIYPGETMVPTLEIDLAWHTHMLHPSSYLAFTLSHIGRLINHNDNIEPQKLREYSKRTNEAWNSINIHPLMTSYKNGCGSDKQEPASVFNNGQQTYFHVSNRNYITAPLPESNMSYLTKTSAPLAESNQHNKPSPGAKGFKTKCKTVVKVVTGAIGILDEARLSKRHHARERRAGSGCGGGGGGDGGGCGGCGGCGGG